MSLTRLRHAIEARSLSTTFLKLTVSRRCYATPHHNAQRSSSSNGSNNSYYNQSREEEEDKALEEEEFAALRDDHDDDAYTPVTHRLAHKADALDADLRRLRYVLCERAQFLVDSVAATFTGRPTNMPRVLDVLARQHETAQHASSAAASSSPMPSTASSMFLKYSSTSPHTLNPKIEAALRASPYAAWRGTPAPVLRFLCSNVFWPGRQHHSNTGDVNGNRVSTELATLDANLDYLRRGRALHQLNYYSRMNLVPKRHIWLALYQILWNLLIAVQNACGCVVYGAVRGVKSQGLGRGICRGGASGLVKACQYLGYGFVVSPLLHLSRGLCNTIYGPWNAYTGTYLFDALSGRWMRCTVGDVRFFRHELQREKRLLRTIGRAEFRRKRMTAEHKWADRMASMGFSVEMMKDRFMPGGGWANHKLGGKGSFNGKSGRSAEDAMPNPYEVLQVRRTASAQEIKKQYKKLAMVFHPDVAQARHSGPLSAAERAEAQHKFEEIANAYQVLSNVEKRRAYDMGGAPGVRLHESKFGKFMSRTPEEMVQNIFGGEGFRRLLVGDLLRSHWALRYEAQVSVSIHELEELQCIRVRQLALELAAMADVHAQRPTTAYYGGGSGAMGSGSHVHGAGGSVSSASPHRRGTSSSLPDYLKSGRPRAKSFGSASDSSGTRASLRTAAKGIEPEMCETIMAELGERKRGGSAATSASAFTSNGIARGTAGAPNTTATGATAAATLGSPYVLRPGSNEYNAFSREFEERCDKFVRHLAEACFGKQLLYEVGEAYVTSAQRFLGVRPFYAPKALVTRKIFTGMDRVLEAFRDKTRSTPQQAVQKLMAEYFNMEYDSVVADIHVALRYAVQTVLQDAVESEEVRRKRCYAVWFLGEKMMTVGEKWTSRIAKDEDLVAYIQQAATSPATTSKPPAF